MAYNFTHIYRTRVMLARPLLSVLLLVVTVGWGVAGCSSADVKGSAPFESVEQSPIVWPLPPQPARIVYLKTLRKPSDVEGDKGFFKKVAAYLVGEKTERVVKPYGIVVDSKGRVVVADTAYKRIHIFDFANKKYRSITSGSKFTFISPIGVAVDILDNIYVSDSGNAGVLVFNRRGRFLYSIGGLIRPTGLAIDNEDNVLYVVDTGAHNVKVFDLKGTYIKTIGLRGKDDGEFNYPIDIFVGEKGNIYVSDSMNFRIQKFNNDGRLLMSFGSHGDGTGFMGRPKGVSVDRDGNIYVVDAIFDTVQIFDKEGKFLLNFGTSGQGAGMFWLPSGIFIDSKSYIYVADSYNKRVQIFKYIGTNDEILKR